jgi:hypothetical protein
MMMMIVTTIRISVTMITINHNDDNDYNEIL